MKFYSKLSQTYDKNISKFLKFLSDVIFKPVQEMLAAVMKQSAREGASIQLKQATIISESMEDILWDRRLLGDSSPATLFNTMVYLTELHFAQRSREEHQHTNHHRYVKKSSHGRRYLEYRDVIYTVIEPKSKPNNCLLQCCQ